MKIIGSAIVALAMSAAVATAGGIDRTTFPYAVLFEKGRVLQLGFSSVRPSIGGTYSSTLTAFGGGQSQTGGMAENYSTLSFAYKADVNDRLSYAIFINSPYGADANYLQGFYTGLEAHWQSDQIAAILKYKVADRVSVYGGLRYVKSSANINIPAALFLTSPVPLGAYTASTNSDGQVGYVVGASYEVPDIALRIGLSYETEITHTFDTQERFATLNGGATIAGTTDIILPQTVTLDFQSGVAKDTLVFGSVRWSEWSQWHVRPSYYNAVINDEVTGFDDDVITYQLGVGRRLNENVSVFARIGYEKSNGGIASRLSPTDGLRSIGIGGSWTNDKVKITGGIEYVQLGDAVDGTDTRFTDNQAVGFGLSVLFSF